MRRSLIIALFLGLTGTASAPAHAQEWPESVRDLRVLVPDARGRRAYGTVPLTRSLRATMAEALVLVPAEELKSAQRRLRLRGRRARRPENLARAGQEAGAQYVLSVRITKKGWLYTATAILINCATGEEQMNFRSQFYKPREESKDRGFRIGKRTIEKLVELLENGGPPTIALAPDPSDAQQRPSEPPSTPLNPDPAPASEPELKDPFGIPSPTTDTGETEVATAPPPPSLEPPSPPVEADPPAFGASPSSNQQLRPEPRPTRVETVRPSSGEELEIIRFSLSGGSGLLRTYTLSADNLNNSLLSYQLSPLSLANLDVEVLTPGIPIYAALQGAFRPVSYSVTLGDLEERTEASGFLLDFGARFGVAVPVSGSGRSALNLIPWLGGRLGVSNASREAGDALVSSTLISVGGGLTTRLPFNEVLELVLGMEAGWIASYSENPTATGNGGSGFSLAADVNARIWLSDLIGIAIDNRFTFEQIGFDGLPTRQVPATEAPNFQDASLKTQDLRSSIGIAFRI